VKKYILEDTRSGIKTLTFIEKNIRLHSAYDPLKEAKRSIADFDKKKSSLILVSGLGLAYHINELKIKYPEISILVLEYSEEVINITKNIYPDYLKDTFLIQSSSDLASIFEDLNISAFKGISHFIHRPSYQINQEFYDSITGEIKQYISSKISDMLTRYEFEEVWVKNIFKNIHHLFQSGSINDFKGKFNGYPGIIVSAGPSLRKNFHHLDEIKDKALIVSVDTAIKVLDKQNIQPHIVMTLDAQRHSQKHFQGLRNNNFALLADIVSYPPILRYYKGDKLLSTTSKFYTNLKGEAKRETTPSIDWIEKYTKPIGDIQSGGSVATSVFDLLLLLGCDPIIFVGQDLAYTGREIHCSGTHHNDSWLPKYNRLLNLNTINQKVIRKRKIKYVPGFGGNEDVISDFVFDLYKSWFEDSAKKVSVEVINATEGGAKIDNCKETTLSNLISTLPEQKKRPDEIIKSIIQKNKNSDSKKLKDGLTNAIENINKIIKYTKNNDSVKIFDLIEKKNLAKLYNPFLKRTGTYITRYNDKVKDEEKIILKEIDSVSIKLLSAIKNSIKNLDLI
jgi:hypothetical protein